MSNTKGASAETPAETEKAPLTEVPKQKSAPDENTTVHEGDVVDERSTRQIITDSLSNKKFLASLVGAVVGGSLLYIIKQRNTAENEDETTSS